MNWFRPFRFERWAKALWAKFPSRSQGGRMLQKSADNHRRHPERFPPNVPQERRRDDHHEDD